MRIEALVLTLAGALWVGACAGSAQHGSQASLPPDVGEVPPELRGDYESFAVNCSKCHDLDRALAAPVTDVRHWDIYVAKMMRTAGSAINAKEAPHILRFLYWYTEQRQKGPDARKQGASAYQPPAVPAVAPSPALPAAKEETQAPVPVPSQTEGESTP